MTRPMPVQVDPVCGMDVVVQQSKYSTTYRGIGFHFCSEQCQSQFLTSPDIYASERHRPGKDPVLKRRKLRFQACATDVIDQAVQRIGRMMGVKSVTLLGSTMLSVEYDLWQVTLEQLEMTARATGLIIEDGWHRVQRSWWKFGERNEIDNLARAGNGACCNRPPSRFR